MTKRYPTGKALAAFAFSLGVIAAGGVAPTPALAADEGATAGSSSHAVGRLAAWVVSSGDNNGLPFAIVDKPGATVFVYAADGQLLGAEPALLGSAHGDDSVPGIGERPLPSILPEERTTPAGRFIAGFGPAAGQGRVLWVDFASAVALHPVVTSNKTEKRMERLLSAAVDDNRITYGCINVTIDFYNRVIQQAFKDTRGVFYVLPDTKSVAEVFPSAWIQAQAAGAAPADQVAADAAPSAVIRTSAD